ncbi:MAG: type II toxin-antitoxin system VapC family toxin [Blastocatellia bacterium]
MKYLLDTHAFLWAVSAPASLSATARQEIEDLQHELLVSTASLWEIAIKFSLGKLQLSSPYEVFIPYQLALLGTGILAASTDHYATVARLPHHHRDPFDRLIIAQSLVEQVPIISVDDKFDAYGIQRIW